MKYKNKLEKLRNRQKVWDNLSNKDKDASTRPGSQKK